MLDAILGLLQQSPPSAETKFSKSLLRDLQSESLLADDKVAPMPRMEPLGSDVDALARIIISESDGEPLRGKQAVANVIMNRVKSKRYGFKDNDSVLKAISDRGQFESYGNDMYKEANKSKN